MRRTGLTLLTDVCTPSYLPDIPDRETHRSRMARMLGPRPINKPPLFGEAGDMADDTITALEDPHINLQDPARLGMYRAMVECRQLGLRAHKLFLEGLVKGSTHMSAGQEAIAAGFGAAMRADDYTFCTY